MCIFGCSIYVLLFIAVRGGGRDSSVDTGQSYSWSGRDGKLPFIHKTNILSTNSTKEVCILAPKIYKYISCARLNVSMYGVVVMFISKSAERHASLTLANPTPFRDKPLQDLYSLHSFLALVNHHFIAPSICMTPFICVPHTFEILWHDLCATYNPPPELFYVCHTSYNIGNGG